jgi:hypothetical protein
MPRPFACRYPHAPRSIYTIFANVFTNAHSHAGDGTKFAGAGWPCADKGSAYCYRHEGNTRSFYSRPTDTYDQQRDDMDQGSVERKRFVTSDLFACDVLESVYL